LAHPVLIIEKSGVMLTSPEYLSIIIEFSIGLAGFSAIVSVFLHRSNELRKVDRHRVSNLLSFSLIPGFVALTCIGLELTLNDLDTATRLSSGLLGVSVFGLIAFALLDRRSIPEDQQPLIHTGIGARFFVSAAAVNVMAQTGAAFGFIPSAPTLFFGLLVTLLLGVIQFFRIILIRGTGDV
jgi:hypothetical protein